MSGGVLTGRSAGKKVAELRLSKNNNSSREQDDSRVGAECSERQSG